MPQPAALWPSLHNILWQQLTIFCSGYYQVPGTNCYSVTYPEEMEGRVVLSTMSVNNLLNARGCHLTVFLMGLEPATSESLVQDLTTVPPSHVLRQI